MSIATQDHKPHPGDTNGKATRSLSPWLAFSLVIPIIQTSSGDSEESGMNDMQRKSFSKELTKFLNSEYVAVGVRIGAYSHSSHEGDIDNQVKSTTV